LFLKDAKEAGFSGIEVSDNLLKIDPRKKKAAISKAVKEFGLTVMGEVGRKEGSMTKEELIADVENCLDAGASIVLLEAHELFHGESGRRFWMNWTKKSLSKESCSSFLSLCSRM